MSDNETCTVRLTVEVQNCGIAYLLDKEPGGYADTPAQSIALIEVEQGCANLRITHQWGPANFTVTIADRDPGADLAAYEDVVEIGWRAQPTRSMTITFRYGPRSPRTRLSSRPRVTLFSTFEIQRNTCGTVKCDVSWAATSSTWSNRLPSASLRATPAAPASRAIIHMRKAIGRALNGAADGLPQSARAPGR
ncbi:hypothetical protein OUY22_06465 [Nonomuraea sp. MCN248]|uniref:Uncharacterized protein n=1 Tax=Nonomuraea corallina TaxID=2989783 RepID=A0ABT4S783_9ACTN|nr:hypothetical protein [Nonomuraea corallina]MDA0633058.1 hypothetical protein [Nonomuraea corallina]